MGGVVMFAVTALLDFSSAGRTPSRRSSKAPPLDLEQEDGQKQGVVMDDGAFDAELEETMAKSCREYRELDRFFTHMQERGNKQCGIDRSCMLRITCNAMEEVIPRMQHQELHCSLAGPWLEHTKLAY